MSALIAIHTQFGWLLQFLPVVVMGWALVRREPLQRVAPILLDINVALGLLTYLLTGSQVSLWHPVLMFVAVALAHAVAHQRDSRIVMAVWLVVLALVVTSVQIAAGRISL